MTAISPAVQHFLFAALTATVAVVASGHAILYKRDSRSAVGWVGLIWLVPILGATLYLLFGINRIRRRATDRRSYHTVVCVSEDGTYARGGGEPCEPPDRPDSGTSLRQTLGRLVNGISRHALTEGNQVRVLENGDEAYPEMIAAIEDAERTVVLSSYIFDDDPVGRDFADALRRARARGVSVRVLVDAVGARYSRPPITRRLERANVPTARFGRTILPWRMPYINLRNHRKLLVTDGRIGFTGGLNIRAGCVLASAPRHPVQDLHFRLEGPVVAHLAETFAEDWAFTTGEELRGPEWEGSCEAAGLIAARGLADGPDEDFEIALHTFLGALACARSSVRIMTPYFLPDSSLLEALKIASMRGVDVRIQLPAANNLALVQWAATAQLWQVLAAGCRVFYTPPPFDHSKLLVVDEDWVLFGSSNWDARSLRLNFEFQVECYDPSFVARVGRILDRKLSGARPVTLEEVEARSLPVRLRDGLARLAAPYL